MQLRFYAKGDLLVAMPGSAVVRRNADTGDAGQPRKWVGREHIPAADGQAARMPATPEPFACDADSDRGRRLVKLVRRDASLWPADKATADACGVHFVETVFVNGEHVDKSKVDDKSKTKPVVKTDKA